MTIAGALFLAAFAAALHWKRRVPRLVAWVLLFVGIGAASVVLGWIPAIRGISILGVGIMGLLAIFLIVVFFEEAVKKNGLHRVRTPIVALALGVTLSAMGGTIGGALSGLFNGAGTQLSNAVTTGFSEK